MMRFLVLLIFPFVLSTYSFAGDDVVIKSSDYPDGGGLEIPATDSITLDTQGSMFSKAHGSSFGPPDTIAVHYMGDDVRGYYSMPYDAKEKLIKIDAERLTPRKSPSFPGYEAGAAVFLMIGREFPEGSLDMGVFADQWTLNIRVER
jgi:hypothetical protein